MTTTLNEKLQAELQKPTHELLAALHAAASPGPWWQDRDGIVYDANERPLGCVSKLDDAVAIVAAHNLIPKLTAELDALQAELTDIRKRVALAGVGLSDKAIAL